jgi:hypothetical protein
MVTFTALIAVNQKKSDENMKWRSTGFMEPKNGKSLKKKKAMEFIVVLTEK